MGSLWAALVALVVFAGLVCGAAIAIWGDTRARMEQQERDEQ